jgi:uncharacterized integral membrane protein
VQLWLSRILLALVLFTALAFGALNGTQVELDVLLARWNLPLGVALLVFLVIGFLLGACALYLFKVFPLKREIASLKKAQLSSAQSKS